MDSVSSKAATAATGVGIGSRAGANSRDSRMKPPVPFPAGNKKYMVKKIGGGTSVIGGGKQSFYNEVPVGSHSIGQRAAR